jgi:hypothetical protein
MFTTRITRTLLVGATASALAAGAASQQAPAKPGIQGQSSEFAPTAQVATNWREDHAYNLGVSAFLYGLPYAYFQGLRYKYPWVKATPEANARANQFWHQRDFTSPKEKDGGTPNTNLFYSVASFDVSKEPLILSVPEINDRYYTHQFMSMDSDNFAYVGTRATGTRAGHYAIVGPNWKGTLPEGVVALPPSRTPFGMIYGRTWVDGPADLPKAIAIQNQYQLTPLSVWGKPNARAPEVETPWAPLDPKADPLAVWKNINRALTENPPDARHAAILGQFAKIGVGPGQDVDRMDEATKRGLLRAAADGRLLIRKAFVQSMGKRVGSWGYPPPAVGRSTQVDDYMLRAVTALVGNGINDQEENVYMVNPRDADGKQLNSAERYGIRFAPGQLPKADPRGYWSLTLYGMDNDLVENPIKRYTFANKPAGSFKTDADGSVTFHVQADSPGADKEANWLPSPAGGKPFYLILRIYLPGKDILEQRYVPPSVTRIN